MHSVSAQAPTRTANMSHSRQLHHRDGFDANAADRRTGMYDVRVSCICRGRINHPPRFSPTFHHVFRLANVFCADITEFGCRGSNRHRINSRNSIQVRTTSQDFNVCDANAHFAFCHFHSVSLLLFHHAGKPTRSQFNSAVRISFDFLASGNFDGHIAHPIFLWSYRYAPQSTSPAKSIFHCGTKMSIPSLSMTTNWTFPNKKRKP